jgi:hypothetical protein
MATTNQPLNNQRQASPVVRLVPVNVVDNPVNF